MANEHESNKNRGNNNRSEGDGAQQPPPPKQPATPAEIAKCVSNVSALLVDYSANEQLRIIAAVKLTNGLQEQATRPAQRPAGNTNNSNSNNQRRS